MDGFTEGRIVHFVLPNGQHRPAIIVNTWREVGQSCDGYANLQVFTDGRNDVGALGDEAASGLYWATSVCHSDAHEPRTWHWIERV